MLQSRRTRTGWLQCPATPSLRVMLIPTSQAAQMMSDHHDNRPTSRPPPNQGGYGKPMSPRPDAYAQHHQQRPPQQHQGYGGVGYGQPPPHNAYASPPTQHGFGQRPPPVSRPPPTPAPPAGNGADPTLYPLFKAVDKDGGYFFASGEWRRLTRL